MIDYRSLTWLGVLLLARIRVHVVVVVTVHVALLLIGLGRQWLVLSVAVIWALDQRTWSVSTSIFPLA